MMRRMDIATFEASLGGDAPPDGVGTALAALWHAAREDWQLAHEIVQADENDPRNNWVHAYLHRVEGDLGNAGYWYRRAGRPSADGDLKAEWRAMATELLGSPSGT